MTLIWYKQYEEKNVSKNKFIVREYSIYLCKISYTSILFKKQPTGNKIIYTAILTTQLIN